VSQTIIDDVKTRKLVFKEVVEAIEAHIANIDDLPINDVIERFGTVERAKEIQERLRKLAKKYRQGE